MNRRHRTFFDAEHIVQNLCHGREAIGGARRVRNNVVLRRIVSFIVYAQDNRDVLTLGRRRNDDLLYRSLHVLLSVVGTCKTPRRFDHHLRAQARPVDLGRIFNRENSDLLVVYMDAVAFCPNMVMQLAKNGIILEEMANVFVSVKSFAATNSMLGLFRPARTTLRPMRPKPLIPTLIGIPPF